MLDQMENVKSCLSSLPKYDSTLGLTGISWVCLCSLYKQDLSHLVAEDVLLCVFSHVW